MQLHLNVLSIYIKHNTKKENNRAINVLLEDEAPARSNKIQEENSQTH